MLKIKNYYLKNNRCYKQNKKRTPIGIQIHSIGTAQGTGKAVADYWNQENVSALVTYICDCDSEGLVYKLVDEDVYTWADGGYGNRNLITIEICESDFMRYTGGANYTVTNNTKFEADLWRGYDTAVLLCADICKRYGWNPLDRLSNGLYLISSHDEGRIAGLSTAHVDPTHVWTRIGTDMNKFRQAVANVMRKGGLTVPSAPVEVKYYRVRKSWTDAESQIGAFVELENAISACPAGYSVFDSTGKNVYTFSSKTTGTQASEFAGLSEDMSAIKILDMVAKCDGSGILYSVSAAQMILESGYVKTNLARSANNCFGMKTKLSNNTWTGSSWDGKSKVTISTQEVYSGKWVTVEAPFRKYPCIEDSIKDHSAYLLGAMNGSKLRYEGLLNAKDYKEAITIIKNGGYATDPDYISKICKIIERFGLNKYDKKTTKVEVKPVETKEVRYRVQLGAYKVKGNAVKKLKAAEKVGLSAEVAENGGQYFVWLKTRYKTLANATTRATKIKRLYKLDAIVKEET